MKVLIVGAGVAGLAIGWRLAQAGLSVEIVERGVAGRGATWASAGMIAPGAELGQRPGGVAQFAREARMQWPAFAAELEKASGSEVFFRETGSLLVAETPESARTLEAQASVLASRGDAVIWLPSDALRKREALLSPALLGALHVAGDAQVDNRALTGALCVAAQRLGVVLHEYCEVRSILVDEGHARAVVTAQGPMAADLIILACGAWMNLVGGVSATDLPPVRPVKGQMVACDPPAGVALPDSLIWAEDVYLVPRKTRLFIGATVEDARYDMSVTREARDSLLGAATRLIPSLGDWRVAEMWAGLRPRTPDDAPVLGATGVDGLYVASGQFRNGILFAPLVADCLRRLILGESPGAQISAFDPRRFTDS